MSEACQASPTGRGNGRNDSAAVGRAAADWLGLAAAPTFAIMALIAATFAGGRQDILCSAAHDASPLSGMVPMYLLMSAFHSPPWLKLISGRSGSAVASPPIA
jgi:hypothetical protein